MHSVLYHDINVLTNLALTAT